MNPKAPVYPIYRKEGVKVFEANGLAIRDYIAIEMMKALVSREDTWVGGTGDERARISYTYADRLIAESNKTNENTNKNLS